MPSTAQQTIAELRRLMAVAGFDHGSVEMQRPQPLSPEDQALADDLWRVARGQKLRVERVVTSEVFRTKVIITNGRA